MSFPQASLALVVFATVAVEARAVTDADVDAAVHRGMEALLNGQVRWWTLRVKAPGEPAKEIRAQVLSRSGAVVHILAEDGNEYDLPAGQIESRELREAHWPEEEGIHFGGLTALATFALLSAGMSQHEPALQHAIRFLERCDPPGTYSRALRANVWAALIERGPGVEERVRYRRLLAEDARWLREAMDGDGWYDYGSRVAPVGDNSCTQFGVLGMWACANVLREVEASYWRQVEDHWLELQHADGWWAYGRHDWSPRETMVVAGINSLYIVLDQFHAGRGAQYVRFEGIRKSVQNLSEEGRVLAGIEHGLAWMEQHMVPTAQVVYWKGYRQFGMERLGVASGLKYIGGRDWYREGVEAAVRRTWGHDDAEDSFWLLFLVYGRAPILFNKLQVGAPESSSYYQRDLHYLCRYFNERYENIHKWQIVTPDSPLHDLQDAPLLYINGTGRIEFTEEQGARLRAFCDKGGTIVGHANLSSEEFAESFKAQLAALFRERDWRFERLEAGHPVYRAGGQTGDAAPVVPLEGMSDGLRTFIFLLPQDIAGAWHRNLDRTHRDLFEIMVNIRLYAAPGYSQLPGRLRAEGFAGSAAPPIGSVRVARLRRGAIVCPTAWQEMNPWMKHHRGLTVEEAGDVAAGVPANAADGDVLHIAGRGPWRPDEALRTALRAYMAGGGLVLADAVGGDRAFAESFEQYLREEFPGGVRWIDAAHPILTGRMPGGGPLEGLRANRWSLAPLAGRARPPICTAGSGAAVGVVFCPFDLTAAMNGHLVFESVGYETESARRIVGNVLAYALARRTGAVETRPATQPSEDSRDLREVLQPEKFPG